MQWLRRRWLQYRINKALQRPFNRHVPDRVRIMELLYLLREEQFDDYKPAVADRVVVSLLYPTVQELITRLQEISSELHLKEFAQASQVSFSRKEHTIEQYLVTKDGYIYDVRGAVKALRHYAEDICSILDAQEEVDASSTFYEHNTRVLTNELGDVDELARGLLQVAATKGE